MIIGTRDVILPGVIIIRRRGKKAREKALAPTLRIERGVHGDTRHIRLQLSLTLEPAERPIELEHHLLPDILGLPAGTHHANHRRSNDTFIAPDDLAERRRIAG